jgi:geranylgeranyl diphosphate synthase type I
MKEKTADPEEAMKKIQKIFKKRGTKALEMARKEILQEKIECKEVQDALTYFMTKYWRDLARPSLLSLVCEAVGGDPDDAINFAIPMILISGAIDIHDDIIDQSKRKEGQLTVYGKYGRNIALLVGDALLFKGLTLLNTKIYGNISKEGILDIVEIIKNMFFELGDAEALEMNIRCNINTSTEEYIYIVRKKAADVEAHTRISAILSNAPPKHVEALADFGRALGMMIILRDDLIDLIDLDESKERLKRECLPLPILYGLQDPDVKSELRSILKKVNITKKDSRKILDIVYSSKAIEQYRGFMDGLAKKAISKIQFLKNNGKLLKLLIKCMHT